MEHIRQYDWCALLPDSQYFVTEQELDNCVTEKILRNKFHNPLVSSDSEEEGDGLPKFDWNTLLRKRNNEHNIHRLFVPGLRPTPAFTRLSALTVQQHHQCLKVLCAQNPHILQDEFLQRPTKHDLRVFEELKEVYQKEQKEFIEWAKTLWTNGQCIRALRPKPLIETVYEAEFKVRAHHMTGYPRVFEVVAQIPLESKGEFVMVMMEELIGVSLSSLPVAESPLRLRSRRSVLRPGPVPEPCEMHPVRFILPNEKTFSVLPIIEVNRELAQYAAEHGVQFIASEGALRCIVERRAWTIPVSVYNVPTPDGGSGNVIVLGSEFMNKQENVITRTFRALRHLLEFALVPGSDVTQSSQATATPAATATKDTLDTSVTLDTSLILDTSHATRAPDCPDGSDDEGNLLIDFDDDAPNTESDVISNSTACERNMVVDETDNTSQREMETANGNNESIVEGFGVYQCTCKDTIFEKPPPRSFRKWQIRNKTTSEHFDVIVHCGHKFRGSSGEVLIEPIPEYQTELGASKQNEDRVSSLAVSLALRDMNASVLNVRLDAQAGDLITLEELSRDKFLGIHGDRSDGCIRAIHTALGQLQGLVPGHYVMQHEPSHGDNALLYAPRNTGEEQQLKLEFDSTQPAEADEAKSVKTPPEITPTLLPWHKFRKILPCAFTHYPSQLMKAKKLPPRKKTPPRALKWPKKRKGRKPNAN